MWSRNVVAHRCAHSYQVRDLFYHLSHDAESENKLRNHVGVVVFLQVTLKTKWLYG